MKIGIIGAGFTGLTAAYELIKKGHQIIIFEKDNFCGGLASGIKQVVDDYPKDWTWDLERFYHHWFSNSPLVIKLAEELGLKNKLFQKETTSSILSGDQIYPYDSPADYLRFPNLPLPDKIRGAAILGLLKILPNGRFLEKWTAADFLRKAMGQRAFETPWRSLLIGKFGDDWDKVNMAWFWSRIKDRTKKLMYLEGGFQILIDAITNYIKSNNGEIRFQSSVQKIEVVENQRIAISSNGQTEAFDKVIFTGSPSLLARLAPNLPTDYKDSLEKKNITLASQSLILVLDNPLMNKVYWLNINDERKEGLSRPSRDKPLFRYPFLAVVEQTNFVDPKNYGGNHLVYIGEYLKTDHPHYQITKEELLKLYQPYLERIRQQFNNVTMKQCSNVTILHSWLFREPFAQPVFPINHSKDIPPLKTPIPNLYLASMNQIYPYDRGTERAIELGGRLAELVTNMKNLVS